MKKVLITGADGFVGLNLTQIWAKRFALTAFVLPHRREFYKNFCSNTKTHPHQNIQIKEGLFTDVVALKDAVKEADYIVHCAGNMLGRKYEKYLAANSDSVRQLLEAVSEVNPNVQRIVLLSSQAAMGSAPLGKIQTEDDLPQPLSFYGKSKLAGELEAEAYFQKLPITILRPCSIYGPWDRSFLRMFELASKGQFGILYDREKYFNLIHVNDLVRSIELAFSDQGSGKRFLIADSTPYTWEDLIHIFSEIYRRPMKIIQLKSWIADLYLRFFDMKEFLTGRPDILSSAKAKELKEKNWLCSSEKFSQQFSWNPEHALKPGFAEVADWYKTHKWF